MLLQVENYVIIASNNLYNDYKVALDTLKVIFHVNFLYSNKISFDKKWCSRYFPSERTFYYVSKIDLRLLILEYRKHPVSEANAIFRSLSN